MFLHLLSSGFFCLVSWNRLRKEFPNLESFHRLIDNTAHLARDLVGETGQTETTSPKTILQWTKINGEDIYIVFLLCFWPVRKLGVNHQSIAWHNAAWPLLLLLVVKVVIMEIITMVILADHEDATSSAAMMTWNLSVVGSGPIRQPMKSSPSKYLK